MAAAPASAPICHGSPSTGAAMVLPTSASATPRQVLDDPSNGRPSTNLRPPSIGHASPGAESSGRQYGHAVGHGDQSQGLSNGGKLRNHAVVGWSLRREMPKTC